MHGLAIFLICSCIFGLAWSAVWSGGSDCDSKIAAYRQCTDQIRHDRQAEIKKKSDDEKPVIEKCFTTNGCTVPGDKSDQSNNSATRQQREQCHKDLNVALKAQVRTCVRKTNPNFEFPPDEDQTPGMSKMKNGKKGLEKACKGSADKAKAVETCIKTSRPDKGLTPDQQKQRFDENCQKKNHCENALGNCRPQLEALKQTVCQCNQDARLDANVDSARASTPSCKGLTENGKKGKQQGTKRPCTHNDQEKDWCTEGYDAWKNSHKKPQGGPGGK